MNSKTTSRLGKLLRLPAADRRLLMRAAIALVTTKIAVKTMSLAGARKAITRIQVIGRRPATPPSPERIAWAVVTAGRLMPGLENCLVQALTAEVILARAGHACYLRIGAAKSGPHKLLAHAWIEHDGEVLVGNFEPDQFRPLTAPGG